MLTCSQFNAAVLCSAELAFFLAVCVKNLFQRKLSNAGHFMISNDECYRNNHTSVFLFTFVRGRFKHVQLQVNTVYVCMSGWVCLKE